MIDITSKLMLNRLNSSDKQDFDKLSHESFSNNTDFWSHPSTYLWIARDDYNFIIGCYYENKLIAYIKLDLFIDSKELETRLIGINLKMSPLKIEFPVLYISRSATEKSFRKMGINTYLRKVAFSLGHKAGLRYAVTSIIDGSISTYFLKKINAKFIDNPILWNNNLYKSNRLSKMAIINLKDENFTPIDSAPSSELFDSFQNWLTTRINSSDLKRSSVEINQISLASKLKSTKYEYTKNQHFQFGFNKKLFNISTHPKDIFYASYGKCQRNPQDFKSECIIAAKEIYQRTPNKPIYLCFSGGIDSEVMCESFRAADIPFHIIISRYNSGLNEHDYSWALKYCKSHNFNYSFFDIDVFKFYESDEFLEITKKIQVRYPMLAVTMKLMEHVILNLKGLPILGSADCLIEKIDRKNWYLIEPEPIQSLYRYLIYNQYEGIPGFFQWSPELMYAFIMDDEIKKLLNNEYPEIWSSTKVKFKMYKKHFNLEPRDKFRGFEKFEEFMKKKLEEVSVYIPTKNQAAIFEINKLIEQISFQIRK